MSELATKWQERLWRKVLLPLPGGNAEIAVLPVSEILPVRGVELVGTIPAEIQGVSVFAAAVVAGTKGDRIVQTADRFPRIAKSGEGD